MNVTVTGVADNEDVDYYAVEARKGDRITAEVEGTRLGITLFDPYVANRNNGLVIWESQTGREYFDLRGHTAAITDVSWRLDSNVVASSSEDGSIKLWELENGDNIKSIGARGGGVESVRFAKDGRLVSTGRDRIVRVWDSSGNKQREFEAFGDIALEAVFSQDETKVIAADWSGEIRVWDAKDGKRLANLAVNPAPVAVRLDQVQKAHAAAQAEAESLSKQLVPLRTAVAAAVAAQAKARQEMAAAEQAAAQQTALVGQHDQVLKAKLAASSAATATFQAAEQLASQTQAAQVAAEKAVAESAPAEKAAAEKNLADAKAAAGAATANLANPKKNLDQASAAKAAAEKTLAEKRAPIDAALARAQALKIELDALSAESKRASAKGGLATASSAPAQTTR